MDDPSAWLAADYKNKQDAYIYTLTPEDIKEVDAAIALVEEGGLRIEVCFNCHLLCLYIHHFNAQEICRHVFDFAG